MYTQGTKKRRDPFLTGRGAEFGAVQKLGVHHRTHGVRQDPMRMMMMPVLLRRVHGSETNQERCDWQPF